MIIDVAMGTDTGLVREQNEDAIGGDPQAGLVILADGMGGANAGEVASHLAIDLLVNQLLEERGEDSPPLSSEDLLAAMQQVNLAILELSQQVPEYRGMGTTLVLGMFRETSLVYAHVGDSRLYRLREGNLEQLTGDHTMIQEMVNMGDFATLEEALLAGVPQNVLTRAFGAESEVVVDLAETDIREDDLYLFCSDGLTGMVTDQEIQGVLEPPQEDLMKKVDALIEFACKMGGLDNISVILARVANGG